MTAKLVIDLDIQSAYDEQYTEELTTWRELGGKYKAQNIVEVSKGYTFHNVLECGAGEGSILMHLDRMQFCQELYAVEISDSGIAAINRRNLQSLKRVSKFNGYELPFPDRFFDLVILSHVLEHVEHPRLLLRELKRVSNYQIIEIPIEYSPTVDQRTKFFLSYGHINIFTPALLRFLLKSEGFAVLTDKYSISHPEIVKYSQYTNRRQQKTLLSELKRVIHTYRREMQWKLTSKQYRSEFFFNAYTVLCEDSGEDLKIL